MKRKHVLMFICVCAVSLVAAPVRRAMLPPSPWVDTEISTNVAMAAWEPHQKSFAYELVFR